MKKIVQFNDALYTALKSFASVRGITVTTVIEKAVYDFLKNSKSDLSGDDYKKCIKVYESVCRDVAKLRPYSKKYNPVLSGEIE